MRSTKSVWAVTLLIFCFLLLAGCGKPAKLSPVSGKVVLPKNFKFSESDTISITFLPSDVQAQGGSAVVNNKDMTFSTNVPTGSYKLVIELKPYPGEKDSEKRAREFENFNGKHGLRATPLTYEVTEGPQTITIDAASGKVTKN